MIVYKVNCKKCGYTIKTEFADIGMIALNLHFVNTGHRTNLNGIEVKINEQ